MSLNLFVVYDGEEEFWYSAESQEQALQMYFEPLLPEGETDPSKVHNLPRPIDEIVVRAIAPDTLLKITDGKTGEVSEKTAAEWAAEGAGYIAGTVQ